MAVAGRLRAFLQDRGVDYEVVPHAPAGTSSETAQRAHVPGAQLAKAVVVEDSSHCALVVLPATKQVHLGEMRRELGDNWALATEQAVERLFPDCDIGSVPPFGQAYGLEVLLDEALLDQGSIYVESGDRAALLRLRGDDFRRLMSDSRQGRYGYAS